MTTPAADYQRLGPLLATAFDRGVLVTIKYWPWIVLLTVINVAVAIRFNDMYGWVAFASGASWNFFAAAGAMRTIDPTFRFTPKLAVLFVASYIVFFFSILGGLVVLILPGVWLFTRFSLSMPAVVFEGEKTGVGLARSWALTEGRFWPTLLLAVVVALAMLATAYAPPLVVGAFITVIKNISEANSPRVYDVTAAAMFFTYAYASVSGWLAYLLWYQRISSTSSILDEPDSHIVGASSSHEPSAESSPLPSRS